LRPAGTRRLIMGWRHGERMAQLLTRNKSQGAKSLGGVVKV
jgi:hypothetical protein